MKKHILKKGSLDHRGLRGTSLCGVVEPEAPTIDNEFCSTAEWHVGFYSTLDKYTAEPTCDACILISVQCPHLIYTYE